MMRYAEIIIPGITAIFLTLSGISFSQDCYDYKHTADPIAEKVIIENTLNSDFFKSYKASYPWYIERSETGEFSSALDQPITWKDKIPIEHTSNCVSTHQGEHVMDFCSATFKSGVLELEIEGGMPAYSSSLLVTIKDQNFNCFFKAAYPEWNPNCLKWKIISKKLKLKNAHIKKGNRLYAWISVVFDETSTGRGITKTETYKIEGYLKPVVK